MPVRYPLRAGAFVVLSLLFTAPAVQAQDTTSVALEQLQVTVDSMETASDGLDAQDSTAASLGQLRASVDSMEVTMDSLRAVEARRLVAQEQARRGWIAPYTVTLGATFDLLDGISATDLYGEVGVFRPTLFARVDSTQTAPDLPHSGTKFAGFIGRLGIDGGLIRGRSITREDTVQATRRINFYDAARDSLVTVQQAYTRTAEGSSEYLSLYATLTYPLLVPDLYALFHVDVRRRDLTRDVTTRIDSTRTQSFADTSLVAPSVPLGTFDPDDGERRFRESERFVHFGVGVLLDSRDVAEGVRYRLKGVIGFRDDRVPFYLVQFQLAEREFGLRLGGEIQGIFLPSRGQSVIRTGPVQFTGFPPSVITVYLAKVFSLERLGSFLGS